jgi:alkanesulfonate monooxygenase SsuD/methylene tetrahydromethanopterin reductase-like flavin-dependent oxidoreductase (luciferase family)
MREVAMRFGLFGSAQARRGGPDVDSGQGFRDFIDYNVEAEALGFYSTFLVEHHFTGFGQVSASLNLLTWLGARTRTLRLGTAGFRCWARLPTQRILRVLHPDGGGRRAL